MATREPVRLLNLDLLRLAAAAAVLLFHYGFRMARTGDGGGVAFPEIAPVAQWLDAGLLVFFAISGYVIALSADRRTAFEFAAGRIARLWPAFVACAGVTALVLSVWQVPGLAPPTLKQGLAHLVIVSRLLGQPFLDGAYWTIVYELLFYGFVFLLLAAGLWERHWRKAVLLWLLVAAFNEGVLGSEILHKLLITQYAGLFAFGLVLYRTRGRHGETANALTLLAAFLCAVSAPFTTEPYIVAQYGLHRPPLGLAMVGVLSPLLVVAAVRLPALPIRPTAALALGALTYPLYLLHQNIGYAVFARFGTPENRWLVAALLVLALLLLSHLVATQVEPRGRRLVLAMAGATQGLGRRLQLRLAARRGNRAPA